MSADGSLLAKQLLDKSRLRLQQPLRFECPGVTAGQGVSGSQPFADTSLELATLPLRQASLDAEEQRRDRGGIAVPCLARQRIDRFDSCSYQVTSHREREEFTNGIHA